MRPMMPLTILVLLAGCATAAVVPQPIAPAASPQSFILARQAGMHMATTLMIKSLKRAATTGSDVHDQDAAADGLVLWAKAIPGLFPPGSLAPGSRARPEIWANKADFDARAADLQDAATRLSQLVAAGDKAGFAAQVAVVQSRCAACHDKYRAPE